MKYSLALIALFLAACGGGDPSGKPIGLMGYELFNDVDIKNGRFHMSIDADKGDAPGSIENELVPAILKSNCPGGYQVDERRAFLVQRVLGSETYRVHLEGACRS